MVHVVIVDNRCVVCDAAQGRHVVCYFFLRRVRLETQFVLYLLYVIDDVMLRVIRSFFIYVFFFCMGLIIGIYHINW